NTAPSVFPLASCCTSTSRTCRDRQVVCLVTGFSPSSVKIQWNSAGVTQKGKNFPEMMARNGLYTQTSMLTILASDWKSDTYQCSVTHDGTGKTVSKKFLEPSLVKPPSAPITTKGSAGNLSSMPEVFLVPPSLEDLYIAQNATITCLVSDLETPSRPNISCSRRNGDTLTLESTEPVPHPNGTYSATSTLRVSVEEWQAGEEFTFTVKHQDIPSAEVKTINKNREVSLRAPSIYIFPPHAEELALQKWATITCLVSGFWPRNILVTWTRKDRNIPQEAYTNIGPMREAGEEESYFIYSKLRIQASEWQKGDTYFCMVVHEGLPKIFNQRNVDKTSVPEVEDQGVCAEGEEGESDPLWTPVTFIVLFLLCLVYSASVTLLKVR
uniref:Ig-like domain-containing protein n=1 Tax=Pelodiscus sinensis TaxID=13735 RepID=K7GDM8_PELSI